MIKTLSYRDIDIKSLKENINSTIDKVAANVLPIMEDVKTLGDGALRKYSKKFDGVDFKEGGFQVTDREIQDAYNRIDEEFMEAFRRAKKNIWEYHERDKRNSWFDCLSLGGIWGRVIRPLKRIGIYVPGGTAAYPSSVLMNGIPAIIAGVEEIVMVTPPDNKGVVPPHTLAAACELGIKEIYKIGGAQSIAALAYGTESIRPVSKITGPGNIYVTAAKKLVFGQVDIDMLAGPSEIFIIADKGADPRFVAADMLSQAEHDPDSFS
ncbi:MAG: histidinol dehydrogenase, partial [Clostridia bacterium]|nr:histidinol dehydrogenase [Clostridia bacterium]